MFDRYIDWCSKGPDFIDIYYPLTTWPAKWISQWKALFLNYHLLVSPGHYERVLCHFKKWIKATGNPELISKLKEIQDLDQAKKWVDELYDGPIEDSLLHPIELRKTKSLESV